MNAGSTLPEHITRITRILGGYCSRETPARSAAAYPHQLQRNPKILGLNSSPVAILNSLLRQITALFIYGFLLGQPIASLDKISLSRINLAKDLFIGIVLQRNAPVGHLALQSPSPLQRMGFTQAFLPFGVSRNSMAP